MKPVFLDATRQAEFDERGFVKVRVMSKKAAAAARRELNLLVPADERAGEGPDPTPYHATYLHPDVAYKRAAHDFAVRLLGDALDALVEDYRIAIGSFFIKPGNSAEVPLHTDWTITEDPTDTTLNIWCALVDADDHNGTLALLPGSHAVSTNVATAGVRPFYLGYADELKGRCIPVPVDAGEALIFDNSIIHWSLPNRSADTRSCVLATCIPKRSRPVFYALDPASSGGRFECWDVGEYGYLDQSHEEMARGGVLGQSLGFRVVDYRPVTLREFDRSTGWEPRLPVPPSAGKLRHLAGSARKLASRVWRRD